MHTTTESSHLQHLQLISCEAGTLCSSAFSCMALHELQMEWGMSLFAFLTSCQQLQLKMFVLCNNGKIELNKETIGASLARKWENKTGDQTCALCREIKESGFFTEGALCVKPTKMLLVAVRKLTLWCESNTRDKNRAEVTVHWKISWIFAAFLHIWWWIEREHASFDGEIIVCLRGSFGISSCDCHCWLCQWWFIPLFALELKSIMISFGFSSFFSHHHFTGSSSWSPIQMLVWAAQCDCQSIHANHESVLALCLLWIWHLGDKSSSQWFHQTWCRQVLLFKDKQTDQSPEEVWQKSWRREPCVTMILPVMILTGCDKKNWKASSEECHKTARFEQGKHDAALHRQF